MMILIFFICVVSLLSGNTIGIFLNDGSTCKSNQLACADGSKCVSTSSLCDYVKDCTDASDELNWDLCKDLLECKEGKVKCQKCNPNNSRNNCRYTSHACYDIVDVCKDTENFKCLKNIDFCQEIKGGSLKKPVEKTFEMFPEFKALLTSIATVFNETVWKATGTPCPPLYTLYQQKCIFVFTPFQYSWSMSEVFCKSMSGSLAVLSNLTEYKIVLDFLKEKNMKTNFWIGGKYELQLNGLNTGGVWRWRDNSTVEMGSPFWGVFFPDQEDSEKRLFPLNSISFGRCLSLKEENFYYFSDTDCSQALTPICMTDPHKTGASPVLEPDNEIVLEPTSIPVTTGRVGE